MALICTTRCCTLRALVCFQQGLLNVYTMHEPLLLEYCVEQWNTSVELRASMTKNLWTQWNRYADFFLETSCWWLDKMMFKGVAGAGTA
jgi:hypothetical protein